MERILINTANAEDLENIEDQLDANGASIMITMKVAA